MDNTTVDWVAPTRPQHYRRALGLGSKSRMGARAGENPEMPETEVFFHCPWNEDSGWKLNFIKEK